MMYFAKQVNSRTESGPIAPNSSREKSRKASSTLPWPRWVRYFSKKLEAMGLFVSSMDLVSIGI